MNSLTTEQKARIISQYKPYQEQISLLCSAGQEALDYADGSGRPILQEAIWMAQMHLNDLPTVIPLSEISDEHAIEVGRMTGIWSKADLKECGDEILDQLKGYGKLFVAGIGKEYWLGLSCPFAGTMQSILDAYQYLTQCGYDLPQFIGVGHPDNGKTLIQMGLTIDSTTLK